jgi:hypothetical protein
MDIIRLYYYTSVPLLTCNMLFYSITSISASISSSQNVIKFISENKDCDSIIFKNEIADIDLENKLRIIESLIYDIIKKFCNNNEEFERTKKDIQQPQIIDSITLENNEFALVEIKPPTTVLERIDEPIKLALISTSETMQNINTLITEMRDKINNHNKSYMKNFLALSLQIELKNLHKQVKILDSRLHLLLELLKIYLPIREK